LSIFINLTFCLSDCPLSSLSVVLFAFLSAFISLYVSLLFFSLGRTFEKFISLLPVYHLSVACLLYLCLFVMIVFPIICPFVTICFFIKVVFCRLSLTKGLSYSMSLCLGVLSIGTQLQQVYKYIFLAHSYWKKTAACLSNGSQRLGIMFIAHYTPGLCEYCICYTYVFLVYYRLLG
jgi:hypothetical protein